MKDSYLPEEIVNALDEQYNRGKRDGQQLEQMDSLSKFLEILNNNTLAENIANESPAHYDITMRIIEVYRDVLKKELNIVFNK